MYRALHRNGRRAAVKLLHPSMSVNPDYVRRFLREGALANGIEHDGVTSFFDDDRTEDGQVFLVMELLDGEALDEVQARQGALPASEALAVLEAVLEVLVAAHAAGVVHRDIKPANVFVLRRGAVKVLDFGIARATRGQSGPTTRDGEVYGSPGFMAPEQALGQIDQISARTDVWSAGALLYSLLTNEQLHRGGTANESLLRAMTEPAPRAKRLIGDFPELWHLLDKSLSWSPRERYESAGRMLDDVRAARSLFPGGLPVIEAAGPGASPSRVATPAGGSAPPMTVTWRPGSSRWSTAKVLICGLTSACLVGAVVLGTRAPSTDAAIESHAARAAAPRRTRVQAAVASSLTAAPSPPPVVPAKPTGALRPLRAHPAQSVSAPASEAPGSKTPPLGPRDPFEARR